MDDADSTPDVGGANPGVNTGADSLNATQVTVGTGITQILPQNLTRRCVTITNTGTNPVYIGGPAVATNTGDLIIGTAGTWKSYFVTCAIYGIATGGSQAVTIAEEFDAGGA